MRKVIICLVASLVFSVTGAFAHGTDHGSELTESQASEQASRMVSGIVESGKIDASWAQVQAVEVKKRTYEGTAEWVITFNNPEERDPEKQNLYLFLSMSGEYLAANHTGK